MRWFGQDLLMHDDRYHSVLRLWLLVSGGCDWDSLTGKAYLDLGFGNAIRMDKSFEDCLGALLRKVFIEFCRTNGVSLANEDGFKFWVILHLGSHCANGVRILCGHHELPVAK